MKHLPVVIKVGGSFFTDLANKQGAQKLLETIAKLHQREQSVVLVHGGGEQVLTRLSALGIVSNKKNGLRITPDEDMPIVTSVLAGELNKTLAAQCSQYGINAVGISLSDGDLAICSEHAAKIGAVGEPHALNSTLLDALLAVNMLPIVASIGKDKNGRLYNVNADHAAICIAQLLSAPLYFFADVSGVLDANRQPITYLDKANSEYLIKEGIITDGMVVKVEAAQYAANQINKPVTIASWHQAEELLVHSRPCGTAVLPAGEESATSVS